MSSVVDWYFRSLIQGPCQSTVLAASPAQQVIITFLWRGSTAFGPLSYWRVWGGIDIFTELEASNVSKVGLLKDSRKCVCVCVYVCRTGESKP